jgi:hypothetical protein
MGIDDHCWQSRHSGLPDLRGTRSGKRYFAAVVDNAAAIILALACAALLPIHHDMTRGL